MRVFPLKRERPLIGIFILATLALLCSTAPLAINFPKCVFWNASASVPIGLYALASDPSLKAGDLVVTDLPNDIREIADRRHYLPKSVPMIKPVAALAGTEVCRTGTDIYVNRKRVAIAREEDRLHRPLPRWRGCNHVSTGQVFLMNPQVSDSFDSRYFGAIDQSLILGRAVPLWTFGPSIRDRTPK